jgi:hypothetical protein
MFLLSISSSRVAAVVAVRILTFREQAVVAVLAVTVQVFLAPRLAVVVQPKAH